MMKTIVLSLSVLLLLSTSAWSTPPIPAQDGEWEFIVESEIIGMPMKMPPLTYKQCINKDAPVPRNEQPGQKCVTKDVKISGNTVTWTLQCKSAEGEMEGKGKATYTKQSMQGTMTMNVQGMTMVNKYKGRRIGPCK